jgi:tripartite-type tricarboxylate transporter receptor subunit TctC
MFRSACAAIAVLLSVAGIAPYAVAAYPDQPIRLLVPAEAGGGTDFIARVIGPRLSGILGQTVIIENRAGASGTIAGNAVAKAKPDGYMLVLAQSTSVVAAQHIYKQLSYDPLKDLAPITLVALVPNLLVVNAHSSVRSVDDLIALAKSKPGAISYGSSGYGSPSHLAGKMFEKMAGTKMLHVPYKGAGPASTALLGGQIEVMFAPINAVLPMVRGNQLRALGITTKDRLTALPDIPTVSESGLPGFDINSWFGLFAPAHTPPDVIARLNEAVALTLKDPKVMQVLRDQAAEPVGNSTAAFVSFLQAENSKTINLIQDTAAEAR